VIRDHVEDDLDPDAVRVVDQLLERREVAQMLVDRVEVDRAVSVIVGDRLAVVTLSFVQLVVVVVDRVEPDGRDA